MKINEMLKPCPFCGRDVKVCSLEMAGGGISHITVDCSCGVRFEVTEDNLFYAGGIPYQAGKSAIEKWNERVIPERTEDSND